MRLFLFLIINFGALFIGSLFMGEGPMGNWYQGLDKAPWTPPGWVFGAAWTTIMICFSVYMSRLTQLKTSTSVLMLFGIQVILNITWNYLFFSQHLVLISLIEIVSLTLLILSMFLIYYKTLAWHSLLIAPYLIWLCIASSLNAYIYLYN